MILYVTNRWCKKLDKLFIIVVGHGVYAADYRPQSAKVKVSYWVYLGNTQQPNMSNTESTELPDPKTGICSWGFSVIIAGANV